MGQGMTWAKADEQIQHSTPRRQPPKTAGNEGVTSHVQGIGPGAEPVAVPGAAPLPPPPGAARAAAQLSPKSLIL